MPAARGAANEANRSGAVALVRMGNVTGRWRADRRGMVMRGPERGGEGDHGFRFRGDDWGRVCFRD